MTPLRTRAIDALLAAGLSITHEQAVNALLSANLLHDPKIVYAAGFSEGFEHGLVEPSPPRGDEGGKRPPRDRETPLRLAVDRALRLMGDARAHEIEVRQTGVMGTRYVDAEAILRAAMDGTPRVDEARIERAARAVYPHLTGEEWDDERFAFVAAMAREIAQDALAAADQEDTDA